MEIDPGVEEKKAGSEVSTGKQYRNDRERSALLFFSNLPVEREPHLALLPSAKIPSPNPVIIKVESAADPTKFGTATIKVIP